MEENEGKPPTLCERIAEAIPARLTATPHVGVGGARRMKIAMAVLPVVEELLAERDMLKAAWDRMDELIESYPPGSNFAQSGAQALFRRIHALTVPEHGEESKTNG